MSRNNDKDIELMAYDIAKALNKIVNKHTNIKLKQRMGKKSVIQSIAETKFIKSLQEVLGGEGGLI